MIERRLKTLILTFLWIVVFEDAIIFVLAWLTPELWFHSFHNTEPAGLEITLLRRSAGQWAAFALGHGITLWRWRKEPVWLVVSAGLRFSDLFTDVSYILSAPALTTLGWVLLSPLALMNLVGVVILLRGYRQTQRPAPAAAAHVPEAGDAVASGRR